MGKVSLMQPASSVPSPTLRCYSPHPSETLRLSNVPPTNSRMFHSSPFMRNHQRGHSSKNKYVAIKILSGSATQLNHEHKLRELEVLQRLSSIHSQQPDYCARLATRFFQKDNGEHLYLVMDLFHASVEGVRDALHGEFFPVPNRETYIASCITWHCALAQMRDCSCWCV